MEREGFDIPLLIGGATTSRVHTAVKIHPQLRARAGGLRHRREPRGRRRLQPAVAGGEGAATSRPSAPSTARWPTRTPAPRPTSSACRSRRRAPTASRSTGPRYQPPKPTFTGTRVFRTYDVAELVPYIDWTPFFQTWDMQGPLPGDPRRRRAGRGCAPALRRCAGHAAQDRRGALVQPEGGDRLLARQRGRRRHSPLHGRKPERGARDLLRPAPAALEARRAAEPLPVRFRGAGWDGPARLRRRASW